MYVLYIHIAKSHNKADFDIAFYKINNQRTNDQYLMKDKIVS